MTNGKDLSSESDNTQVSQHKPKEEYHVVLPCEVKDFRNFVAGLLGKPQEVKGEVDGSFQVTHAEISNFCHLVTQRVDRQNDSSLINQGITVFYDDGNSVTHHNVRDFEAYYPTTKCIPIGISIDFTYLIKFQNKQTPEKQEINISFDTDSERAMQRIGRWFHSGLFTYRILHTERTWASDISGLLKSHAETIMVKESPLVKFIRKYESEITLNTGLIVFVAIVILWCRSTLSMLDNPEVFFKHFTDTSINKYWVISATIISVMVAVLYSIKNFFETNISLQSSSLIVLTDKDQERQNKKNSRYILRWLLYISGWFMSILSGIVSTYIYNNTM